MSNLEQAPAESLCTGRATAGPVHELLEARVVPITKTSLVSRTLPHRDRRMVGAWCFVDHYGPDAVITMPGMRVPPHPHTGLQTVSWLLDGLVEHRDSLGTVQSIAPGQLNLMTAGRGISHSEESPQDRPPYLHGVQLWVALPEEARHVEPRFEHVAALPHVVDGGLDLTVLVGEVAGHRSPARVHTPLVGADAVLAPGTSSVLPLDPAFEHAVLVMSGAAEVDGVRLEPGRLLYLGSHREDLSLRCADGTPADGARVLLLGGEPFEEQIVMWWNFVGRSHEEIEAFRAEWTAGLAAGGSERFGVVRGFDGDPLPAPALPNARLTPRGRHR